MNLTINGIVCAVENATSITLMDYLRNTHGLKSVKDGCSQGACGTCTVIVDGVAQRSCTSVSSLEDDAEVLTVEGLTEREKAVYDFAFAETGAVQCGFCTPGMVMSAKALLDKQPDPSDADIKHALRKNICRCTGYVKIIDAIHLAAKYFREQLEVPTATGAGKLGESLHRVDAREKTLGYGVYVDDMALPGMLHGKALRSQYPRAIIKRINIDKALQHADAVCVLTAKDIPGERLHGHIVQDWHTLVAEGETTHYIGDALALVASHDPHKLDEILALIDVEYEPLTPLSSPAQALADDAPQLHPNSAGNVLYRERLVRGDAASAIANAKYVVTKHYSTPFTDHAFMEPECAIAVYEAGGMLLYTGGQGIYDDQREVAHMLGLPVDNVRVQSKLVGGGFGGKEDLSVQHHAALLAWHCRVPVKVKFSRQESLLIHPKRHAMEIEMTTACDEHGKLLGMIADIVSDTGAYASLGGPVLQRACTHAAGPYAFDNVSVHGKAVYTNNPPGGAFRGFGVTQSAFALESNINLLAEMVGISAWEMRYRNAVRPGQALPNGQLADNSTALVECLLAVKDTFESHRYAGLAVAFKNSGLGVGNVDIGRCILSVEAGKLHVRSSAACIGQGVATVAVQIICEVTGLSPTQMVVEAPDTARTPDAGTTTASRQTVFTGEAVRRAAVSVKRQLDAGMQLSDLEGQEFLGEYFGKTDPMNSDKPHPVSHIAYGYAAQVVVLDEHGKLAKVVAACDLGHVINRKSAEGQIEGGVVMSLGYALTEDFPLENSVPKVTYKSLGLFKAADTPAIDTIIVDRQFEAEVALGAKGVGELASIPTAPATQAAYYAFDGQFRTKLPLEATPYTKEQKTPKPNRARRART